MPDPAPDLATRTRLAELLGGYLRTQAIAVAAELGIPDLVGDEPVAVADLAARAGADPDALYRVLRLLASLGIFAEAAPRAFARTTLSDGLRDDALHSARHTARFWAAEPYATAGAMLEAVRTGAPVAEGVLGQPFFARMADDPAASDRFNRAMAGGAAGRAAAALRHPWERHGSVADLGGGDGSMLRTVLAAHPHLRGVVFDLPHVVAAVAPADRLTTAAGDFFTDPLPATDVHVLAQILHDWDDERATAILRASRAALGADGTLLLLEQVVAPGDEPSYAKELDLLMLVMLGGRERSEREWADLLAAGGFRLAGVTPAPGTCLLEAVPA